MILQQDVGLDLLAKIRRVLELALGQRLFQIFAAAFVLEDFPRVQVMLDMVAPNYDA
jgi:hypothetical protein